MKKVFSLILVVAMIASMGIVSASAEAYVGLHTSYDVCMLGMGHRFLFAADESMLATGNDDIGDITANIDPSDAALIFAGWHAAEAEILSYGYRVDGGDIKWSEGFITETGQDVIDAGAMVNAVDTTRFSVQVDLNKGTNMVVEIMCKTADREYVIWTCKYTCTKNFKVPNDPTLATVDFNGAADTSDYVSTIADPVFDGPLASFVSAIYKIEDGKMIFKDYGDIRWWSLSLTPSSDYVAVEYDFKADTLVTGTSFCVTSADDPEGKTDNGGDGGKVIVVSPSETAGVYNVADNAGNVVATINAGETYKLSAVFEAGTSNYYIAINGERVETVSAFPVKLTTITAARFNLYTMGEDAEGTQDATIDNIVIKNAKLADYTAGGNTGDDNTGNTGNSGNNGNADTADNTAIVFMIAAAAVVVTVLLKKRAY